MRKKYNLFFEKPFFKNLSASPVSSYVLFLIVWIRIPIRNTDQYNAEGALKGGGLASQVVPVPNTGTLTTNWWKTRQQQILEKESDE